MARIEEDSLVVQRIGTVANNNTFPYVEMFRIAAMKVITSNNIVELDLFENIKTAKSIDEILWLLSLEQIWKLEQVISWYRDKHLIWILKVMTEGESALDYYRDELRKTWSEVNDKELINYIESIKGEFKDDSWRVNKLLAILYAKMWDYWSAIDCLNEGVLLNVDEDELWKICVHIWIYFERMWEHELSKRLITTAQRVWWKRWVIKKLLEICERNIKK